MNIEKINENFSYNVCCTCGKLLATNITNTSYMNIMCSVCFRETSFAIIDDDLKIVHYTK